MFLLVNKAKGTSFIMTYIKKNKKHWLELGYSE